MISQKLYNHNPKNVKDNMTHLAHSEWQRWTEVGLDYHKNITNNISTNHWAETTKPLVPSSYLDCAIDVDKIALLSPTMQDVIILMLEADAVGERSKKKIAICQVDMVDVNAKSYARWLNSPERMNKFIDYNKLQALIVGMKLEKDEEKERKK